MLYNLCLSGACEPHVTGGSSSRGATLLTESHNAAHDLSENAPVLRGLVSTAIGQYVWTKSRNNNITIKVNEPATRRDVIDSSERAMKTSLGKSLPICHNRT